VDAWKSNKEENKKGGKKEKKAGALGV